TGALVVSATAAAGGAALNLELWDATGTTRLGTGSAITDLSGVVTGRQISLQTNSGTKYLVHLSGGLVPSYSLVVQSLTADLGPTVPGTVGGPISAGGQAVYRLAAAVGGSLEITLTSDAGVTGNLNLKVLSADGQTVLASGIATSSPGPGEVEHVSLA